MGSLDAHSEAIKGSSQAQAGGEVRIDKGKNAPKRPRTTRKKDIQQEVPQEVQQEVQQEEPPQKRARIEREHSSTSALSVQEVEMFSHPAGPPPENIPTPDILNINASQGHNQPRSQRPESPSHQEEAHQDSFVEVILGEMEGESQEQEHVEVHSHSILAPDCLLGRLRKEPEKEIDPVREFEELLKKMDQPAERKAP